VALVLRRVMFCPRGCNGFIRLGQGAKIGKAVSLAICQLARPIGKIVDLHRCGLRNGSVPFQISEPVRPFIDDSCPETMHAVCQEKDRLVHDGLVDIAAPALLLVRMRRLGPAGRSPSFRLWLSTR